MDACDGLFPLIKVCFVRSEMNRPELQTYIFEHVSTADVYVPVSGQSGTVPTGSEPDQADHDVKVKKSNICNNSSHIREKDCLNLRGKDFNCSEPAWI